MSIPEGNKIDLEREEDKYIVPKQYYIEVKSEIRKYMKPYFPQPNTVYTSNRSIYFDSSDLTFLKQHLSKQEDRRKIRIRAYAPNGNWSDECFVEVKYKNDGESRKMRLRIGPDAFDSLIHKGELPIDNELLQYNSDIDKDEVLKEAKLLNYLLIVNKARPVVDILYKRYAYQDGEDLRVTIDQDIKVIPIEIPQLEVIQSLKNLDLYDKLKELGAEYSNHDDFILEVKHQDNVPDWMEHLIKELDLEDQPFSKYVWAMAQVIDKSLDLASK